MGYGGSYHEDVSTARSALGTRRDSSAAFEYNARANSGAATGVHPDMNIFGRTRECLDSTAHPRSTPIWIGSDLTLSRGDDPKRISERVPAMMAALELTGIVPDPEICFAGIGDATVDKAPLQFGQFEPDKVLDKWLHLLWMEKGGAGTGTTSYEIAAYYLARKVILDSVRKRQEKGFAFFLGDEAPYKDVSRHYVKQIVGDELKKDVPTATIFKEMQKLWNTFLIFPATSVEERRKDIDAEIRRRLQKAGGRFKNVDIRGSLIWYDYNDLDLHCTTPDGWEIFYPHAQRRSPCGGELDVDANGIDAKTNKPVENIRWAKGDAQPGKYTFWVERYAYHEHARTATEFKFELDVNGKITTVEQKIPAGVTGSASRIVLAEFDYIPVRENQVVEESHDAYSDEVVLSAWQKLIPRENILRVKHAESSVELMLGVMALTKVSMTLSQFAESMAERRVPERERVDALAALEKFAREAILIDVGSEAFQ